MNKVLIWGGLIIVALGLIIYGVAADTQSRENGEQKIAPVASVVTVAEPPHNFGDIDIFGGTVSTDYTLKNEGAEDVTILSGVTSCTCTEGEIGNLWFGMHETSGGTVVIPAGEERTLTATYDPLAHGPDGVGPVTRELYLKTNSTKTPEIRVIFAANVVKNSAN
jgi:hypothetical protein